MQAGHHLAVVGTSGNSSEPHLHLQLMDDRRSPWRRAFRSAGATSSCGPATSTRARSTKPIPTEVEPGLPANGQVFTAGVLAESTPH